MTDAVNAASANDADVATAQRRGLEAATAQRNTTHKHRKKFMWGIAIFVAILFVKGFMVYGLPELKAWRAEIAKEEAAEAAQRQARATARSIPQVSEKTVTWDTKGTDGSLPLNEWSQTLTIGIGCRTTYDGGNGTDYKVRYRFYSPEWKEHPGTGNYPPANEVQFMLLKPRSVVPVKVACS